MNTSITHDLFDQTNGVSRVGFIKEHHSVHVLHTILFGLLLGFLDEFLNVIFSSSTMYLQADLSQPLLQTIVLNYLHNEHVSFVFSLSGKVTHVSYEPCLSTASLSHDHHWNTTTEPHLNGKDLDQIVHCQDVSLIRIVRKLYPHHRGDLLNHCALLPLSVIVVKVHSVLFEASV